MNKTDKKIEEILELFNKWNIELPNHKCDDSCDTDGGCVEKAYEEANAREFIKELNTEVQKAVKEAIKGFVEWYNGEQLFKMKTIKGFEDKAIPIKSVETYLQTLKENKEDKPSESKEEL